MNRKQRLIIKNIATLKNTILLALLFLIMLLFIMPDANEQVRQYAPDVEIIDGLFYYFPDQLYQMITAYGERGRKLYVVVELSADFIFSIVTAAFLSSFLIWTVAKLKHNTIKFELLIWLPLLSVIANCMENAGIIWILVNYPEKYFYLAIATSVFTLSKWLLLITSTSIAVWNTAQLLFLKFQSFQNADKSILEDNLK